MGIAVWRVTMNPKIDHFGGHVGFRPEKSVTTNAARSEKVMISTSGLAAEIPDATDGCAVKS